MASSKIRVAVAGARGKMGAITVDALRAAHDVEYVGGLVRERPQADEFDDVTRLVSHAKPDVIVDFTHMPESRQIALAAIAAGVRPVIGTSGYGSSDVEELRTASGRAKIGCIFAPNFGVGAVLMMKFAADAARHYRAVEIIEMHETGKKDAPSGTAMATARRLASAGTFERPPTALFKAHGARGAEIQGIGIHSLRMPGVIAHQEVLFGGAGETLRITHDSTSRASFMPGVLLAVRAAKGLTTFVDGLETLL
jgi:4-hydroxy-tetrahydrodipicolinate reductase